LSCDHEFHRRIIILSRNERLIRLTESYRALGKAVQLTTNGKIINADHAAIVQAIKGNRPDDVEQMMREHIRSQKPRIERQIADGTFAPKWVV